MVFGFLIGTTKLKQKRMNHKLYISHLPIIHSIEADFFSHITNKNTRFWQQGFRVSYRNDKAKTEMNESQIVHKAPKYTGFSKRAAAGSTATVTRVPAAGYLCKMVEEIRSCYPEVKASKSDQRLRSYSHLKICLVSDPCLNLFGYP